MKRIFTMFNFLFFLLIGSSAVMAQENKTQKEFRPVTIMDNIDKPEGMAVIGNILYVSQYHINGSIIQYDIVNKVMLGKVIEGLNYPTGLLALNDQLIVLEFGTGSLYTVHPENGQKELMTTGFSHPADVILWKDQLLVSDFGRGIIYTVNPNTYEKSVFATGLASPAGMAVFNDQIHVVEWAMGRISKINTDGTKEIVVNEGLSSPWGLMVYKDDMYVAENGSNEISKIYEVKVPVENSSEGGPDHRMNPLQDSISVWKVSSMKCIGLSHPEAFSVSERGIYISEWESKEVSEILLNSPPSGELLLTGKAKLGNFVYAAPQNIQDEDGLGPFSYRWQISDYPESDIWKDIEGRKEEHKLKNESLVGKYIRAMLSYTDQGGLDEYVYSNAKLIIKTYAPQVTLSLYPNDILLPGDTVTLTAKISVLDEDAVEDKVEFYSDGLPLISLASAPYRYSFVVQDNQTKEGYINQLSITAKGYDSNGLFGEDEQTIYVTNEEHLESDFAALFSAADADISFFPNPAKDMLNVVSKKKESIRIRVIDLSKKVVLSTVINNGFKTLDISKLIPGTYIIEYTIGDETRAEKIIKL